MRRLVAGLVLGGSLAGTQPAIAQSGAEVAADCWTALTRAPIEQAELPMGWAWSGASLGFDGWHAVVAQRDGPGYITVTVTCWPDPPLFVERTGRLDAFLTGSTRVALPTIGDASVVTRDRDDRLVITWAHGGFVGSVAANAGSGVDAISVAVGVDARLGDSVGGPPLDPALDGCTSRLAAIPLEALSFALVVTWTSLDLRRDRLTGTIGLPAELTPGPEPDVTIECAPDAPETPLLPSEGPTPSARWVQDGLLLAVVGRAGTEADYVDAVARGLQALVAQM